VTVRDLIDPNITGLDDQNVEYPEVPSSYHEECLANPDLDICPQASDLCGNVTITFNETTHNGTCLFAYTIVRVWTATDLVGHTVTTQQTINVMDTTPPELHFDHCQVDPDVTEVYEWGEGVPVMDTDCVTATDNSGQSLEVTADETILEEDAVHEYTIVRTFTAEDDCGNVGISVVTLLVVDTTPPELKEYPRDETVECDALASPCVIETVPEPKENMTVFFWQRYENGTYYYTWTASDHAGNTVTHIQAVTVEDTTPPVFSRYPEDVNVSCDCDTFPAFVTIHAKDNCFAGHIVVNQTETRIDGTSPHQYMLVRTWTAVDDFSNSVTHQQTIRVYDDEAPVIIFQPNDMTLPCDMQLPPSGNIARDNCDAEVELSFAQKVVGSNSDDSGCYQLERSWSVADVTGNEASHTYTITVEDNQPPHYDEAPHAVYMNPSEQGQYTQKPDAVETLFQMSDNCGQATVSFVACNVTSGVETVGDDDCQYYADSDNLYLKAFAGYQYTVYAEAEDSCGNVVSLSRQISVCHVDGGCVVDDNFWGQTQISTISTVDSY
jgi:hypothetical protein